MPRFVALLRALVRFLGLVLLTASIIVAGLRHVTKPSIEASRLSRSMLPRLLAHVNVQLGVPEYLLLAKGIGVAYIAFSLFTLLGVGRRFFALQLALLLTCTTILHYVDVYARQPIATKYENALLKNLSIIGGLVFVAASGGRHGALHTHHNHHGNGSMTHGAAGATSGNGAAMTAGADEQRCKKRE